ncbi:MAG: hypothetical protein CM1200mP28_03360 [Deltaproteobacteria bacterium]|nr:MAG: hypothetical protein CM1200mP28_03360 [Deltaproteobacteria bacterium]
MNEKDNDQPEWLEKLFSTQVILTAILILGNFLGFFFGEDKSRDSSVSRYTSQNIPIGNSDQLNPEAIRNWGLILL